MFEFNFTMEVNIKIKINFLHSPNLEWKYTTHSLT